MKVSNIEIAGFRGFNRRQALRTRRGRSLCLYAENGHGKSSVVDALEFWSRGDLGAVHRDGVGLGALAHLEAAESRVELTLDSPACRISRMLVANQAGAVELSHGASVPPGIGDLPILRYEDMASFVAKSAGEKRRELMGFLGLDPLLTFRSGLARRNRQARGQLDQARAQLGTATSNRSTEFPNGDALDAQVEALSQAAGLDPPLAGVDALVRWNPTAAAAQPREIGMLPMVSALQEAEETLLESIPPNWNVLVGDRESQQAAALSALVRVGRQVVDGWTADQCPLCQQQIDHEQLQVDLEARAATLATTEAELKAEDEAVQRHLAAVQAVGKGLSALLGDQSMTVGREDLQARREMLRAYWREVSEARSGRLPLPSSPEAIDASLLESLHGAALERPAEVGPALVSLSRLRGLIEAERAAEAAVREAELGAQAFDRAHTIVNEQVDRAVQDALTELNDLIARFYAALVDVPAYGDVRLVSRQQRSGGIEFSFEWTPGAHTVSPPHRIMSSSQLTALGLAFFLARVKADQSNPWRTIVLDDVVTAFDEVNSTRLLRLLDDDFSDWQIILATHDLSMLKAVANQTSGWIQTKVVRFDPLQGPIFGAGAAAVRLREQLDAGAPADELGGLARIAVEEALETLLFKLRLSIRHDRNNTYAAAEYLDAVSRGLDENGFTHADAPILRRLKDPASVTNRICHHDPTGPGPDRHDLVLLVDDLEELQRLFRCDQCDQPIWFIQDRGSMHSQCQCGELSCA